jgi:hypothetical protein
MAARRWTPKGAIARSSRNLERGRERLINVLGHDAGMLVRYVRAQTLKPVR